MFIRIALIALLATSVATPTLALVIKRGPTTSTTTTTCDRTLCCTTTENPDGTYTTVCRPVATKQ